MFENIIFKWLDTALDCGILEKDFWEMTLNEIERAVKSKIKMERAQDKRQATFDYLLADLIGRSMARIHSASNKMPPLYEAYPTLFEDEEIEQSKEEQRMKLSEIRFKQFAQSFNSKFREGRLENE